MIHPGPHENALWAEPAGGGAWQSRSDTKFPGFVAGGTYDPALGRRRPHDHWFATQMRIITLLNRSVKSIHIEMENDPKHENNPARLYPVPRSPPNNCLRRGAINLINVSLNFIN
jgi:hypothetical protein